MSMRATNEDAYFAASNSAKGFFSYYPQCFDAERIRRVYAVKGGPGTGKSRFLRDVARAGERRGYQAEYVYCSSDPDSLDGVILTRGDDCIALVDATAPHVYEPKRPGVREEIVNLGEFWDSGRLAGRAAEVETLCRAKDAAYRRAYRFLDCAGEMYAERDVLVAPYVRRNRITAYAERITQDVERGDGYEVMPALIRSIGIRGCVENDTYLAEAKKIYLLEDVRGISRFLLEDLGEIAVRKRLRIRVSHDPILPDRLDGLFLCESGIAFVRARESECAYPHRTVSMRRFLDVPAMRRIRGTLNYVERMRRAMISGAEDAMREAGEAHFRLEDIYVDSMDFDAKEKFTGEFCKKLFGLQSE